MNISLCNLDNWRGNFWQILSTCATIPRTFSFKIIAFLCLTCKYKSTLRKLKNENGAHKPLLALVQKWVPKPFFQYILWWLISFQKVLLRQYLLFGHICQLVRPQNALVLEKEQYISRWGKRSTFLADGWLELVQQICKYLEPIHKSNLVIHHPGLAGCFVQVFTGGNQPCKRGVSFLSRLVHTVWVKRFRKPFVFVNLGLAAVESLPFSQEGFGP